MTLYKITAADGSSVHGGSGQWTPGEWREVEGDLVPCRNGLHLVEARDLLNWLVQDGIVWEAEYEGERVDDRRKVVVRKARITRKVGVLNCQILVEFGADCAEHVLPIFEARYPDDDRPRRAIEAARAWLRGDVPPAAVADAAAAAGEAAGVADAADAAATGAASVAYHSAYCAAYAAAADMSTIDGATITMTVAYRAANAAYYTAAAYAAARTAEREWQGRRLLELLEAAR